RSSLFRFDQYGESLPLERRSRIGLARRRDVAVADDMTESISAVQRFQQPRQHPVLPSSVGDRVRALELDAYGKVVAAIATLPARFAGMPRAFAARDELQQLAVAANHEMT